jgi:translation initiation factor 3 subunit F
MADSFPQPLSLPKPHSGPTSTTNVTVQPLPLAAILDHHLRRPDHQDRVFGTLLGVRNAETGEVEVNCCILHQKNQI